jgi:DNA-binding IclR family transcriptional regulator
VDVSSVPAARDALRIVKYLASHSGPVRAATITRDLELPRSTTYHLLKVLQDEGFLLHSPENQAYLLGPLIAEIGSSVLSSTALARLAEPLLERLVSETRMPVVAHLGVLNHSDVVYASKVSANHAPSVVTSIGVRMPAHLTATGRAMLAALPETQLRAIYPHARTSCCAQGLGRARSRNSTRSSTVCVSAAGRLRTATSRSSTPRSPQRFSTTTATRRHPSG